MGCGDLHGGLPFQKVSEILLSVVTSEYFMANNESPKFRCWIVCFFSALKFGVTREFFVEFGMTITKLEMYFKYLID